MARLFQREGGPTPVNVVLTDADLNARANVLKGIRAVLSALNGETALLAVAEPFLRRFIDGERPLVLGEAPGPESAREAAEAGLAAANGHVCIGYGLSEDDLEAIRAEHVRRASEPPSAPERFDLTSLVPEPEDVPSADWRPSFEAAKTACTLLAAHDGNGTAAVAWARVLRKSTGSDLYEDVVRLLLVSLPTHPSA